MGYTTEFRGRFKFDRSLTDDQRDYLRRFSETRRMKRNANLTQTRPDPIRMAVGLPVGVDGGYFVGSECACGQEYNAADVVYHNDPPAGQPGLWCQWVPSDCGNYLEWNDGEKFYYYEEWLEYMIEHFFKKWGLTLTGTVIFQGEKIGDVGFITVKDNSVFVSEVDLPKPTHE